MFCDDSIMRLAWTKWDRYPIKPKNECIYRSLYLDCGVRFWQFYWNVLEGNYSLNFRFQYNWYFIQKYKRKWFDKMNDVYMLFIFIWYSVQSKSSILIIWKNVFIWRKDYASLLGAYFLTIDYNTIFFRNEHYLKEKHIPFLG